MAELLKRCARCREEKQVGAFYRDQGRKDGYGPYCKDCRRNESSGRAEYRRSWYQANRNGVLQRVRAHASTRAGALRAYKKDWYRKNAEAVKDRVSAWQKAHPHVVAWRSLLTNTLQKFGRKKEGRTVALLGYSAEGLRKHLEAHWLPGMSWANHHEWHIDHIRPVCSFPPDTDPRIVNALSNLRPLWASTRIVDGVAHEGNLNRSKKWAA